MTGTNHLRPKPLAMTSAIEPALWFPATRCVTGTDAFTKRVFHPTEY